MSCFSHCRSCSGFGFISLSNPWAQWISGSQRAEFLRRVRSNFATFDSTLTVGPRQRDSRGSLPSPFRALRDCRFSSSRKYSSPASTLSDYPFASPRDPLERPFSRPGAISYYFRRSPDRGALPKVGSRSPGAEGRGESEEQHRVQSRPSETASGRIDLAVPATPILRRYFHARRDARFAGRRAGSATSSGSCK